MTPEKAWDDLKNAAIYYAAAVAKEDKTKMLMFAEITLRGAAKNYADADDETDEK